MLIDNGRELIVGQAEKDVLLVDFGSDRRASYFWQSVKKVVFLFTRELIKDAGFSHRKVVAKSDQIIAEGG